jgi:hypothetical protein
MRKYLGFWALVTLAFSVSTPAHAYLDPGTGSILLQGLIAGVAGGLTVITMYYTRLKHWVLRKLGKDVNAQK